MTIKNGKSPISKNDEMEKTVYTRWINHKLEPFHRIVTDIQHDLCDGSVLMDLIEILCHKKLEINESSTNEKQKRIDNLNKILSFFHSENIDVSNIKSVNIVHGTLKKIMELLWNIIYHYSIKSCMTGIDYGDGRYFNFLNWLNSKLDGHSIDNFSSAWNSGIALGVVVYVCDRDICTDVFCWHPDNAVTNANFAMEAALQCLNIPQLLTPSEMVDLNVSERAIMVYLSQFISLLQDKTHNKCDATARQVSKMEEDGGNTSLMFAALPTDTCPQIPQPDYHVRRNMMKQSSSNDNRVHLVITVPPNQKGLSKKLIVEAVDPHGTIYRCTQNSNYSKSDEIEFSFCPNKSDTFDIFVRDGENNSQVLNQHPFRVKIKCGKQDDDIVAFGPGLHDSVVNQPGVFVLATDGSDRQIGFTMEGPSKTRIECLDLEDGDIKITHYTLVAGIYQLSIVVNDIDICDSPYSVNVSNCLEAQEIKNIEITGLEKSNLQPFIIDMRNTSFTHPPDIECFDKLGNNVTTILIEEIEKQCYRINITLENEGRYIIFAGYNNMQMDNFPYLVNQKPIGCPLQNVETKTTASIFPDKCFEILRERLFDSIELSVKDLCIDNNDQIRPKTDTNLKSDMKDTRSRTKMSHLDKYKWIDQKFGLVLHGESLNGRSVKTNDSLGITIDFSKSDHGGKLELTMEGPGDTHLQCLDNGDGTCEVKYQPVKSGQYELTVKFDEQHIQGSPFFIFVSENQSPNLSPSSKRCHSPVISESKLCISMDAAKHENTLSNFDEFSWHNNCINNMSKALSRVEKSQDSQKEHVRTIILPELSSTESNKSYSFQDSRSNTSRSSILSGIYKARIRRSNVVTSSYYFLKEENPISPINKSQRCHISSSSSSPSSFMEIERISQNYKESVSSFYENMLSAFTNLLAIETIYITVDKVSNLLLSENDLDKSLLENQGKENSLKTAYLTDLSKHNLLELSASSIKTDSNGENRPFNQILVPLRSFNSVDFNTLANNSSHIFSSNNENDIIKAPLMSSFEFLSGKGNEFGNISNEDDYTKVFSSKSSRFAKNGKYRTCPSIDSTTLTQNTNLVFDEFYKSFGVDLSSKSISSNNINRQKSLNKITDAEIVFDSSLIDSRRTTDFISVFDKLFFNNEILQCDLSSSYKSGPNGRNNPPTDYLSSKDENKRCIVSKIINSANSFEIVMKEKMTFHSSVSKSFCLNDRLNDNFISCHSIVPIIIPGRLRSKESNDKDFCLIEHSPCKSSTITQSIVTYRTEVIRSSLFDYGFNIKDHQFHCKEVSTDNGHSTFSILEDNRLVSTNIQKTFILDEVVQSFVITDIPENELKTSPHLEIDQVRNIAVMYTPVDNHHQFKCLNTPLTNNRIFQTNFFQIINTEFDRTIFTEAVQFLISRIVKENLVNRNEQLENLKNGSIVKHGPVEKKAMSLLDMTPSEISQKMNQPSPLLQKTISRKHNIKSKVVLLKLSNNEQEGHTTDVECSKLIHEPLSYESQDISSAVETLVDAITDIAKNHLIKHPSKNNIRRVEELIELLPRLLRFGKEKRLYQINYLTDRLESILLEGQDKTSNKALGQIIKSIKNCVSLNMEGSRRNMWTELGFKNTREFSMPIANNFVTNENSNIQEINELKLTEDQIYVVGNTLHKGIADVDNKFVMHTRIKVPGSLTISIEGPSKAKISFMDQQQSGVYIAYYRVAIPGKYLCSIKFNQVHISHSPFKITVIATANHPSIVQSKTNHSTIPPVDRNIIFHIYSTSISALNCFVTTPSGTCSYVPIEQISTSSSNDGILSLSISQTGLYNFDFYDSLGEKIGNSWTMNITNICGEIAASIVYCNAHIKGSGNQIRDIKLTKINQDLYAFGDGLKFAKVNQKIYFFVYVDNESQKIAGRRPSLDVSIDGPSKVDITCVDNQYGYTFCYIAIVPGIYFIGITYSNEFHIPGSPFKIIAFLDK